MDSIEDYTSSLKGAIEISGQDVNVLGMLTAQQFNVTYVSSSTLFQSGSTKFGDTSDDRHEFTGSIYASSDIQTKIGVTTPVIASANGLPNLAIATDNSQYPHGGLIDIRSNGTGSYMNLTAGNLITIDSTNINILATGSLKVTGSLDINGSVTASVVSSSYIKFDSLPNGTAPSYQEGLLYYDNDMGALTFYNNEADIALQIGQEQYIRVINKSGDDILNGTPVRVSGSQGDMVEIYKAEAFIHTGSYSDSEAHNHILGLATHDILDDETGYVTVGGLVRGINTDIYDAGDILYVQTGSAGVLTNVAPPFPYDKIQVGVVGRKHPSVGEILVMPIEPIHFGNITGLSGSLTTEVGDLWVYKSNNAWATSKVLEGNYEMIGLTASLFATNDVVSGSQQIEEYDVFALNSNLYEVTGSLNEQTASQDLVNLGISVITGSINSYTSSNESWKEDVRGEVNGLETYTASLKAAIEVSGQDVNVLGMLTAQQFNVTYVSSSTMYQSGSTKFGDTADDVHTFTGTINLNGLTLGISELMAQTASQEITNANVNDDINILYDTKLNTSSFNDYTSSLATTGSNTFVGNQTINGSLIIEGVSEVLTIDGGFSGNRDFDYTSGSIFYLTGLTGNGTWNINNVPTTNDRGVTMTFVVQQGGTPYSGSAYSFDSTPVTVKWVDSTVPTGSANKTEVIGLTAFRVGSSWNVLGSLSTFGS